MSTSIRTLDELSLAGLSPEEQRDLLTQLLAEEAADAPTFPLSFNQQRLWFLDQLGTGAAYHIPLALRLEGTLDLPSLTQALNAIVHRHTILRTTYQTVASEPRQVISENVSLSCPLIDLQHLSAAEQTAQVQQLSQTETLVPFDLTRDLMVRAKVVRLAPAQHLLLVTLHHIAADGWSIGILLRELAALYTAFVNRQPSPFPELPIQYADFAHWQHQQLQGAQLDQLLTYWKTQLAGAPRLLELPTDRPRPTIQTFHGAQVSLTLPAGLTQQLRRIGQGAGATLYTVLLTAFQILLARYTGQTDIVVGAPFANRTRQEVEPLIGFFVNTLVLRSNLDGNPTFQEALARVQAVVQAAYVHQDIPFERLVNELVDERSLRYSPLVQVLFALQSAPQSSIEAAGLRIQRLPATAVSAQMDIEMLLWEIDGGIQGGCVYNSDLFDEATIARLIGHFEVLLQAIVNQPDQPVLQLPLLTAAEYQQIVHEWNDTTVDFGPPQTIHALFEQQVERTPDAIAVIVDFGFSILDFGLPDEQPEIENPKSKIQNCLTYAELNARANQLAHYLIDLGVKPDTLVAVMMERSIEMVVSLLAVLKAGGAYVPLDPTYPPERIRFMLADSAAPILLTQSRLPLSQAVDAGNAQMLPPQAGVSQHLVLPQTKVIFLDLDDTAARPVTTPTVQVSPENLIYVIYTSGSTGNPKGVAATHHNTVNRLCWMWKTLPFRDGEVMCQKTALSFVDSVWEIFGPLLRGIPLVMIPDVTLKDPQQLVATLQQQQVTRLVLVPSLLQSLLNAYPDLGHRLPQLAYWTCSGEALSTDLCQQFYKALPGRALLNLYGSSEVAGDATWYNTTQTSNLTAFHSGVPIGKALANTQTLILNGLLQPTPIGVPGELYIGGVQLARGYLNRPDLTAERFLTHSAFGRLYKTGDLCRWLPDGNIEYIGRSDFQVKIRGFRIELGEIESALLAQDGVSEATVVAREDILGDKRLVAYVVQSGKVAAEQSPATDSATLRQALGQRLPEYMLPSAFVFLESLPLTPNGKLDRKALPAPDYAEAQTTFVAPRTALEAQVAAIWQAVLGVERVGVYDNFFALGGHSLLATQVISRLRSQLACEVPLKLLFEATQIASFADLLSQQTATLRRHNRPLLQAAPRQGEPPYHFPLSFAQQRLWFLDQLEPNSAFYNIPLQLRLSGTLDVAALAASLTYLQARHESLRTHFAMVDGEAVQVIEPPVPLPLTVLPVANAEAAHERARQEAATPFNLQSGPLWRVQLLQVHAGVGGNSKHHLLLTLHHIISDGWSSGVLLRELSHAYTAFVQGQQPSLPALPVQYADFAHWQRDYLSGERLAEQLAYWRTQLAGASALLELPTDRPRPPIQSHRGAHYAFQLEPDLMVQLKVLAQSHDATLFMVLLAAFNVLLARYSRQTDIVVGTPIANRTQAEIEGLIGFFVNTLVLRTQLTDNPTFATLLARVRQNTLAAYDQQDLPFEQLVDALQPERSLSYSPLFQVMLVLQNADMGTLTLPNLTASLTFPDFPFAKFDLTLNLMEQAAGLQGMLEYNSDLFDEVTIIRLAGHFEMLLQGIVAQPEQPVLHLPLLTAAEYQQIVHEWNNTTVDFGQPQTLHALFEQQVARTPDAVAVIMAENQRLETRDQRLCVDQSPVSSLQSLTYAELNARANQLAHHLITLGVQADTLVAVMMERSIEMVVSLLAVLKAGGAYVPIDPTYPPERIAFMLQDCAAPILLTQSHLDFAQTMEEEVGKERRQIIAVDQVGRQLAAYPTGNPQTKTTPEHLAYVIYTSGSTGQPKGVLVPHRGLSNLAQAQIRAFVVETGHRVLQVASLNFDASIWEIVMALGAGATLVMASKEAILPGSPLTQTLQQQAITHVTLVPTALAWLEPAELPHLQTLIVAGEAFPAGLAARWRAGRRLLNAYGPTESTVCATIMDCAAWQTWQSSPPIGRPIANVQVYLLDETLQPVPIGVASELYIGGVQVARGYLNRPELTTERFIEHPVFGRLYKTGDLCRWLPDGNPSRPGGTRSGHCIEYIGRTDFQVKIRGFRIELGEIENALLAQEEVREAVVVAREERAGDKRLVAYVVLRDAGNSSPIPALRSALQAKLPEYMMPSAFVLMEAMPLTPNGKLDRKALPAPEYGETQDEFVTPRNTVEAALTTIFAEVLHLPQVGIHDNFFRIGGDSILSIQIVSRAAQQGYRLRVKDLFQQPTVAQLARVVQPAPAQERASQAMQSGDAPLLPIQRWFLGLNQPAMHHFNQSFLLTVKQAIDPQALRTAIASLLQQHDALRFQYSQTESGWQQHYLPLPTEVPLVVVDLQTVALPDRPARIAELSTQTQASLDPLRGDLVRFVYFKTGGTDPSADGSAERLLIVIHHLAVDGVSWRILLEDLTTLLDGEPLPAKTSSYREWGETLQRATQQGYFAADLSRWLAGTSEVSFPLDDPLAANTMATAHHLTLTLAQTQTEHLLRTLPDRHDVSLDAVLLTALTETLTEWSGQRALSVQFESHGRQELFADASDVAPPSLNLNRTVGWFTSVYPLTIPRFTSSAVKRLRYTLDPLRRVSDGGISFGALRDFHPDEAVRSQLAALPTPAVVYNYLGQFSSLETQRFALAEEAAGPTVAPTFHRDTLLDSNALIQNGQLHIHWTVSPQLYRATAEALLATFAQHLDALIAEACETVGHVAIPSEFADANLSLTQLEVLLNKATTIQTGRFALDENDEEF